MIQTAPHTTRVCTISCNVNEYHFPLTVFTMSICHHCWVSCIQQHLATISSNIRCPFLDDRDRACCLIFLNFWTDVVSSISTSPNLCLWLSCIGVDWIKGDCCALAERYVLLRAVLLLKWFIVMMCLMSYKTMYIRWRYQAVLREKPDCKQLDFSICWFAGCSNVNDADSRYLVIKPECASWITSSFLFLLQPVDWPKKLFLAHGVVCGMEYLHSIQPHPVIHGDLKLENVLVGNDLIAKVCALLTTAWCSFRIKNDTVQAIDFIIRSTAFDLYLYKNQLYIFGRLNHI